MTAVILNLTTFGLAVLALLALLVGVRAFCIDTRPDPAIAAAGGCASTSESAAIAATTSSRSAGGARAGLIRSRP
jgi:hypothetical protein